MGVGVLIARQEPTSMRVFNIPHQPGKRQYSRSALTKRGNSKLILRVCIGNDTLCYPCTIAPDYRKGVSMKLPKGVYQRNKSSPNLWITYYDEKGKRQREAAHTTDPKIAENFRNVRLAQVAERRLIPTKQFESITFGEILDFWWERHARHRNSGFEYLIPRLDRFRHVKARNLTPEMIQGFLGDLLKTLSPASVNHYRTIFNSSFNFAIKWKKYDDNPVVPTAQVPEREPRDRFVTVAELAAIVSQCQEENDLELQGFVILAACTGMRRGEIMPRKWSDVRVDDEYPYIYVAKTKNKRPKRLPLPGLAILALRQ